MQLIAPLNGQYMPAIALRHWQIRCVLITTQRIFLLTLLGMVAGVNPCHALIIVTRMLWAVSRDGSTLRMTSKIPAVRSLIPTID